MTQRSDNDPARAVQPPPPPGPPPPSDDEVVADLMGWESKGGDPRVQALVTDLIREEGGQGGEEAAGSGEQAAERREEGAEQDR